MTTQENANASYSRKQTCRVMAITTPNQDGTLVDNHGFTLVELIIAVAIIGILATMAVPAYTEISQKVKNTSAKSDIRTLELAINAYTIDQNKLPNQLTDIGTQANLKDPWKHPYHYFNIITGTGDPGPQYTTYGAPPTNILNDDYDLYSMGADGNTAHLIPDPTDPAASTSKDDIVRAGDGSTVEFASEF